MRAGHDPILVEERKVARLLVEQLDTLPIHQEEERTKIMRQLFGSLIEVGINLHFSAKGMSAHGLHCHCPVLSARM